MGINKIGLSTGEILFDISRDTVTPETLAKGETAHDASGEPIIGTMVAGDDEMLKKVVEGGATEIALPDSVASIKNYCFYGDESLRDIQFTGITEIGNYAFYNCTSLVLTSLPRGITEIGKYAFYNCSNLALTSLPTGITEIGSSTFYNCSKLALKSLPRGINEIGASAFYNCSKLALTSLPTSIKSTIISPSTFYGCTSLALTSLPRGITEIGTSAFYGCTSLTVMDLTQNVNMIRDRVFYKCSSLTTLILRRTTSVTTLYNSNAFTNTPIADGTGYIYVPSTLLASYKTATNWSTYSAQFRAIEDYPKITGG